MADKFKFETLSVSLARPFVYHVELNRPDKMNAMNATMWTELGTAFQELDSTKDCRVIVLSGSGKIFTAGLDLTTALNLVESSASGDDVSRRGKNLKEFIMHCQNGITQLELCSKPVLVAIHSACIGGGTSLITAADVRYCTIDAYFQIKEVALGIVPDVGVIQRMQRMVGSDSLFRELCYTGRKLVASDALSCGLVSKICEDKKSLMIEILNLAVEIAKNSPVAVQGIKESIVYSRDHTVQEGLDQIARFNQFTFQGEDFYAALKGATIKKIPEFQHY